jgi:HNH endonuclease
MVRRARKPDPREVVELRAGRRCEYCRAPQTATGIRYHLEHVFPESLGWSDDVDTLALACPTCNYFKSNHLLGIDEEGSWRVGRYSIHGGTSGTNISSSILRPSNSKGKTNTGKGTVNRLRMNNSIQLEARRLWVELELYP